SLPEQRRQPALHPPRLPALRPATTRAAVALPVLQRLSAPPAALPPLYLPARLPPPGGSPHHRLQIPRPPACRQGTCPAAAAPPAQFLPRCTAALPDHPRAPAHRAPAPTRLQPGARTGARTRRPAAPARGLDNLHPHA